MLHSKHTYQCVALACSTTNALQRCLDVVVQSAWAQNTCPSLVLTCLGGNVVFVLWLGVLFMVQCQYGMWVCCSITLQVHNACFAFSTLCTGFCARQKSSVPHFCCNVCTCMYIVEFCTKNLKSQLQYSYMYFKKMAVGNSRIMLRVGKMQRFRGGWRPKKSGCQIGVAADVRHGRSSFGKGNMWSPHTNDVVPILYWWEFNRYNFLFFNLWIQVVIIRSTSKLCPCSVLHFVPNLYHWVRSDCTI